MSGAGWSLVFGAWLVVGGGVALGLVRRGHPLPAVLAAVPCWPLLLPLLADGTPAAGGPFAHRIPDAIRRLHDALAESGEGVPPDLGALHAALVRADARIARVDRLLVDAQDAAPADRERLHATRAEAVSEVEGVLAELVRLRLQVGLAALVTEPVPVRARLAELGARVGTLEEVASLGVVRRTP